MKNLKEILSKPFIVKTSIDKFYKLIKIFSKNEMKQLKCYLRSQYFIKDKLTYKLFKVLKKEKLQSDFDITLLDKLCEELNSKIKGLKIDRESIIEQTEKLNSFILDFMVVEELFDTKNLNKDNHYSKKSIQFASLQYNVLLKKKLLDQLENQLEKDRKVLKEQRSNKRMSLDYFQLQYLIEITTIKILSKKNEEFPTDFSFKDAITSLDFSYLLKKSDLGLRICNLDREANDPNVLHMAKSLQKTNSLINFYRKESGFYLAKINELIIFLFNKNVSANRKSWYYKRLVNILIDNQDKLIDEDIRTFIITAVNFCHIYSLSAQTSFKDLFELYRIIDSRNLMRYNKDTAHLVIKDFVLIACKANQFRWASKVLSDNINFVNKNHRNEVEQFNTFVIHFYKDKIGKQRKEIIESKFKVSNFSLRYKIGWLMITLKGRYETDENKTTKLFREFKRFINKKTEDELPANKKESYLNFIEILIKIYKIKNSRNDSEYNLASIKEELINQMVNADKFWLIEKIMDLEIVEIKIFHENNIAFEKVENLLNFFENHTYKIENRNDKLLDLLKAKRYVHFYQTLIDFYNYAEDFPNSSPIERMRDYEFIRNKLSRRTVIVEKDWLIQQLDRLKRDLDNMSNWDVQSKN